jgi:hypothetical protein
MASLWRCAAGLAEAITGRRFGAARSHGRRHRHADGGDHDQRRYRSLLHLIHLTPSPAQSMRRPLSKRKRLPLRPLSLNLSVELDPGGSRMRLFNGQYVIVFLRRGRDYRHVRVMKTRLPVRGAAKFARRAKVSTRARLTLREIIAPAQTGYTP